MIELIEEALNNDIIVNFVQMESMVWGFVYQSIKGNYYILINEILSYKMQNNVLQHEINHILKHFPSHTYIIGLDMKHSRLEKEADASIFLS